MYIQIDKSETWKHKLSKDTFGVVLFLGHNKETLILGSYEIAQDMSWSNLVECSSSMYLEGVRCNTRRQCIQDTR